MLLYFAEDFPQVVGFIAFQMPFIAAIYWAGVVVKEVWSHGNSALWLLTGAPVALLWPALQLIFPPI